ALHHAETGQGSRRPWCGPPRTTCLSASPPDRSIVELNCRAGRRIDRTLVQLSDPDVARPVHPASGGLAEIISYVEVPTVLRDGGSPDTCRALRHTSILAAKTDPIYLRRCISCDHSGRHGQCAHEDSHRSSPLVLLAPFAMQRCAPCHFAFPRDERTRFHN